MKMTECGTLVLRYW